MFLSSISIWSITQFFGKRYLVIVDLTSKLISCFYLASKSTEFSLSVKKSFQFNLSSDFITIWRLIKLVCFHSSILNLLLNQNRGKIFLSEQNTLQIGFAIKLESVNQHYNFPKCHLTVLLVLINQLWTTVLCICFSCTPGTLQSQLPICNPDFFLIKRYRFHSDWSH